MSHKACRREALPNECDEAVDTWAIVSSEFIPFLPSFDRKTVDVEVNHRHTER